MTIFSNIRYIWLSLSFILILLSRPVYCQQVVDYIVAVVDNEIILYSDEVSAVKMFLMQDCADEPEDLPKQ